MRVVLLAAGTATRLKPLTDQTPKCLLQVGSRSIISRAVHALAEHGLKDITIVDGFCGEKLRAAVTAEFPEAWFRFIRNDVFATTNNAYSLLAARYSEREPMMLLDADIVFDPAVIATMLSQSEHPNRLALRSRGELGEEEVKVTLGARGRIEDIGKTMDPRSAAGESVGIELFSADFTEKLFRTLERRMNAEGRVNEWYEASFLELMEQGEDIFPVDLGDLRCMEIDTAEDLERARTLF